MNLALARGRNVTTYTSSSEAFSKGEQRIYMLYDNYTIIVARDKFYNPMQDYRALLLINFSTRIYRMLDSKYNLLYELKTLPLVTPFEIHQPCLSAF